ncbi:hypothetical protein [uncultured Rhodospira sp.]|uniref:hypothetical protein n=1 Tax=uncultured Rhodospira sp. TaxID=1936189 RepID=UPI00261004C9|nr:hypothetical protein [uncultured Rhodospira sp.]
MFGHARHQALGRLRRWFFAVWVGLTILAALYIGLLAPLVAYLHDDLWLIAVIIPPLMISLLGIGLGWLVWLVTARRPEPGSGPRRTQSEVNGRRDPDRVG